MAAADDYPQMYEVASREPNHPGVLECRKALQEIDWLRKHVTELTSENARLRYPVLH